MLEAAAIGDMPQRSMDNPYQPPTAPLVAGTTDGPVDRSVTIDSLKGPVTLQRINEHIVIRFNGDAKTILSKKFVTSVVLVFFSTKKVVLRPLKITADLSESKFLELLSFYGLEEFKGHDVKSSRMFNGIVGAFLLGIFVLGSTKVTSLSMQDYALAAIGIICLLLFALTFSRLYLLCYALYAIANLLFATILGLSWYSNGGWWIPLILFFCVLGFWGNLKKFLYFRKLR